MKHAPALPLQQSPQFGAALGLLGRKIERLDLPGAAPVQTLTRFGLRFAPRGPVWDRPDPAALRALRIHVLNTDRDQPDLMRAAGYRQIMTSAHVAELDLKCSHGERLTRAHGKWRNTWRRARRAPFRVKNEPFSPDLHDWLLQADLAQQRSKGYRALPHSVLRAYGALYPADAVLFTARIKREGIAAMLFLCHAPVVTYHLGWSNDAGRQHAAHHALLMQAADHFSARGFTRLELGQVDTVNTPGLARFKIGSGATIRALGGTWLRLPGH